MTEREEVLQLLADGRERTRAQLLHEVRGKATALAWSTIGATLHAMELEGLLDSRQVFVASSSPTTAYRLKGASW